MELAGYLAYEVGAMMNTASNRAVGAAVQVGGDETGRVAVKGRYRRWLGRGAAWDVGTGVVATRRRMPGPAGEPGAYDYVAAVGLAGDVSLGLTDWLGIGVEGDLLFSSGRDPATGLYAGLKLGGKPTKLVTAAGAIIAVVLVAITARGGT